MKHEKSRIIFDASEPIVDTNLFIEQDWAEFYGDMEEELPRLTGKYQCIC
jgi:hypothetical protein